MKHAKRIIALLIACLMFGSTAAMAADAAEDLSLGTPDVNDVLSAEDYSRIYDKTQYDRVFNTEYINVYLKKGVNHLPNYSVDEYKVGNSEMIPIVFVEDGNETERIMVRGVVLKEYRSRENILAIIEKMKDDPYVYYVEPDYKLRPSVAGSTAPFETDAYIGDPDYNDLLYEGEYRRLIGRIEPAFAYYTGNLKISFKVGVDVSECFGTVFSDLNVESVQIKKAAHMETDESGEKVSVMRQEALVTLTDASLEHAYNVSVSLMNHPLVHSAKPEFIDSYCGGGGTEPQPAEPEPAVYVPGDVNVDGYVKNDDLILTARHVVKLVVLTDEQLAAADINEDKTVNNADVIQIARAVVGLAPDNKPKLSQE